MPDDDADKQQKALVVQLADAPVGETAVDEVLSNLELPSSSTEPLLEIRELLSELLESILPASQTDSGTELEASPPPRRAAVDQRLQRILCLLDRYTRNLENIEEQVLLNANQTEQALQLLDQQPQHELATQTLPLRTKRSAPPQQLQQQQVTLELPPCERTHHIITISANSSSPLATPPAPPRNFAGRVAQTFYDFAAACCLCLQVNKDCVFCLGFFLAFVVSASFLTAFFYRSIKLSSSVLRKPMPLTLQTPPQPASTTTPQSYFILRLHGGYYYVYSSQRPPNS
ncbi:uncharacterized protein LOC108602994 [Drosophila busckii]|uniref:uncharacterized protein LOC108602994 n=1 Tax=Drosophila busckii TaxID=30019 RepID=UPI001432C2A3|nr:uncharacterized protein LOC108602994 [Drosophila busckii]